MTFGCAETEARIVDVIDGRLDPPTEMRVHAHLESCPHCREKADAWRKLVPGMRALTPPPLPDLNVHRMQVEILRRIQSAERASTTPRAPRHAPAWRWRAGTLVLVGVAAAFVLWWRASRVPQNVPTATEPAFAIVTHLEGRAMSHGRALFPSEALVAGTELDVAAAGEAELRMDRGTVLRVWGPARLTLGGSARQVDLRLADGKIQADVAHRHADETFAVSTPDLRVEVRGTRFVVGTRSGVRESWVQVQEGLVAVQFTNGRSRLVAAGQSALSADADHEEDEAEVPMGGSDDIGTAPKAAVPVAASSSCRPAVRVCKTATETARASMRRGEHNRALRLVGAAARSRGELDADSCGGALRACQDELRYLRAEALRGAGRVADAVIAYEAINREGAPPAMRQNALYAAAELERQRGHAREALADYERALSTTPRGALHEEALVGAMETAALAGERLRAQTLGQRYLAEFPAGRFARIARKYRDGNDARGDGTAPTR